MRRLRRCAGSWVGLMSDLRAGDRVRTDLGDEGTVVEIKRNAARVAGQLPQVR